MTGRGLIILIAVLALLSLAAYVIRTYAPGIATFLLTLAVLLIILILAAVTGLIPISTS